MQQLPITQNSQDIERFSVLLKAMGHPLRLQILCMLSMGKHHVQEIIEFVGTSQSNVSQHLLKLKEQNILGVSKQANRVYYSISDPRTLVLLQHMHEIFCDDMEIPPAV